MKSKRQKKEKKYHRKIKLTVADQFAMHWIWKIVIKVSSVPVPTVYCLWNEMIVLKKLESLNCIQYLLDLNQNFDCECGKFKRELLNYEHY